MHVLHYMITKRVDVKYDAVCDVNLTRVFLSVMN